MPLRLCGAPSTFQNLLDRLLAGIKTKAAAYIDDIILGAQTVEEMTTNLREGFTRIRTSKLRFSPVECELFQTRVKYLGFYLSEKGFEPDRENIQAIQNMSVPKTKKEMMRFIGGISWFRNHIPNLSEITKPLSDTLRGKRFSMTAEAIKALENRAPQQTQRNDSQDMSMQFPYFERPAHGFHEESGNSSQYGNRQRPYNLRQTIRKPTRYQ